MERLTASISSHVNHSIRHILGSTKFHSKEKPVIIHTLPSSSLNMYIRYGIIIDDAVIQN